MFYKVTLIVLTDYESLLEQFADSSARTRWGVVAMPFLNNGNWLLPLGWEEELTKAGIEFEVKEVEYYQEEI